MTYDFFADKSDKIILLNFIFNETDLKIFDAYSFPGENVKEYKTTQEIISSLDLINDYHLPILFNLWSERHEGPIIFNRIELNPRYSNGKTFRFSTIGWGLIQLYLEGINKNILGHSHIGHFNEKGAFGREGINSSMGKASEWNWTEIQKTSRKLKYQIHNKLAVRINNKYGILPGADALEKSGIILH